MNMKIISYWLTAVFLSVCCTGLTSAETITITDMAGRNIQVPFDPERIACIGAGTLRLIVYLKATSKVVGVEDMEKMNPGGRPYWIAHPELHHLPSCGPGGPASINKKPDLETVLSLSPQVIFTTYMDGALADDVQHAIDLPVVVLSYGEFATFDEAVFDALRIAGSILNRKQRADDVITRIESLRSDLSHRSMGFPDNEKPLVYIGGIGYRGSYGIESTEQQFIPFDWIQANNLADRVSAKIGSHVFMDKEMLLKFNPDVIFIDGGGRVLVKEDYRKKPVYYQALKAFINRRIYNVHPFNWYTTNIGTALSDAYAIGRILYPERFADIDPKAKADEIYTFLVGNPVCREMEKDFGPLGGKVTLK